MAEGLLNIVVAKERIGYVRKFFGGYKPSPQRSPNLHIHTTNNSEQRPKHLSSNIVFSSNELNCLIIFEERNYPEPFRNDNVVPTNL